MAGLCPANYQTPPAPLLHREGREDPDQDRARGARPRDSAAPTPIYGEWEADAG